MKNDKLGVRMKIYESQTTKDRLIPLLPIIARLDSKNFSKFIKSLKNLMMKDYQN